MAKDPPRWIEGPAKATGDAGSVEQHKLSEQIAADKYLQLARWICRLGGAGA